RVEGREERMFVIRDYLMFYRVEGEYILISRLWDGRRNPENLKL
ncbi:MAG: type II toxin-antitoxin system RelE/ParE family toxin, partial [Ignavibacteriae bacterium]|nr:type II toxin-antitoxin system RelE/ParE family toxin [Ignavibacteriota bacterium]